MAIRRLKASPLWFVIWGDEYLCSSARQNGLSMGLIEMGSKESKVWGSLSLGCTLSICQSIFKKLLNNN